MCIREGLDITILLSTPIGLVLFFPFSFTYISINVMYWILALSDIKDVMYTIRLNFVVILLKWLGYSAATYNGI